MNRAVVSFSAFAAVAALSVSASAADVCVQIDGSRDNLSSEERAEARSILQQIIESAGNRISGRGCSQTYILSHTKTAQGIDIRLVGPTGERRGRCANMGDLQRAYRNMMMGTARAAAPKELSAPKRQIADELFYARIGESAVPGAELHGGPDIGLGLRLELDHVGIDASMNLGVSQTGPQMSVTGYRGSWLDVTTHYFFAPEGDSSPYVGLGLSWGSRTEQYCHRKLSGAGLQAELTAGWEFLRSSTIRLFVQADATMPLYLARGELPAGPVYLAQGPIPPSAPEQRYLPSIGLSLGIGWGRPHILAVEKVK